MIHDVIFTPANTNMEISAYDEWKIALTNVENTLPEPKTITVDIKGADGLLDLSEAASGDVRYNNRKLKLTFELLNVNNYDELITDIGNAIHGRMVKVQLTSDDNYYYKGRATISKWECRKRKGTIVVDVDAYPFKINVRDIVRTFTISNDGSISLNVETRKIIVPELEVTGSLTLNGVSLTAGKQKYPEIVLKYGTNTFTVSGTGTVKFIYRAEVL